MKPCPEHFNLAEYVLQADQRVPQAVALIITDGRERQEYQWQDVWSRVAAIQKLLGALELPDEARILIRLPNSIEFAASHLAITASGYVAVPLSPMLTSAEVRFIAEDSDASVMLHNGELPLPDDAGPHAIDIRDVESSLTSALPSFVSSRASDPAYLVYTSGTTGEPKGVLHAHRSVWGRRPMRDGWTGITADDVVLHAGALNWTYTMGIAIYDAWSLGATSIIYVGKKDSGIWPSLIERESATVFAAVPTVYRQLLKYGRDVRGKLATLRHGLTAGEALSPALLEQFEEVTGKRLYEALGMSECSTYISTPPGTEPVPGSPGRPQEGRRIAVLPVDESSTKPLGPGHTGLLAIHRSDPGLMLRYWRRLDENDAAYRGDWFIGGDLAHTDERGYVFFDGRVNDLMNAFGYRVSPDEVEAIIEEHPAVHEVGVAEAQMRQDVSVICAYLVLASEHADEREEAIIRSVASHCEEKLAEYKRPREFRFLSRLPRTRSGKIRRGSLERAWRTGF